MKRRISSDASGKKKSRNARAIPSVTCACDLPACIHDKWCILTYENLFVPPNIFDDRELDDIIRNAPHAQKVIAVHRLFEEHGTRIRRYGNDLVSLSDVHKLSKALHIVIIDSKIEDERKTAFEILRECVGTPMPKLRAIILHFLGVCFLNEIGTARDREAAVNHFCQAIDLGNVESLSYLGECYEKGFHVVQDWPKAIELYTRASDGGSIRGLTLLAMCHLGGIVTPQNFELAVRFFILAYNRGSIRAQISLGLCAKLGRGLAVNPMLTVELYRNAAEQGDARAQYAYARCLHLGIDTERNIIRAITYYKKAAKNGNASAAYYLGRCYDMEFAVRQLDQAVFYYEQAARKGHASAMYHLGLCYENGMGVELDVEIAKSYYLRSAEHGLATASVRLKHFEKHSNTASLELRGRSFSIKFPYKTEGRSNLTMNGVFEHGIEDEEWRTLLRFIIDNDVKVFSFCSNGVTHIPDGLGWEKANLEIVNLAANLLEILPHDISRQRKLIYFDIGENPLKNDAADVIFAMFTNSTHLRQLFMGFGINDDLEIVAQGTMISDANIDAFRSICMTGKRTRESMVNFLLENGLTRSFEISLLEEDRNLRSYMKFSIAQPIFEEIEEHLLPLFIDKTKSSNDIVSFLAKHSRK